MLELMSRPAACSTGGLVVLMSQVPVGYTRAWPTRVRARAPSLPRASTTGGDPGDRRRGGSLPETRAHHPGRPPGPAGARAGRAAERFGCRGAPDETTRAPSSEKAAITLPRDLGDVPNALADLCEATGASMRAIIPALRADRRIGPAGTSDRARAGRGKLERDLVPSRTWPSGPGAGRPLRRHPGAERGPLAALAVSAIERWYPQGGATAAAGALGSSPTEEHGLTKNAVSLRLAADLRSRALLVAYDPLVTASFRCRAGGLCARRRPGADGLVILTDWDELPRPIRRSARGPRAGRWWWTRRGCSTLGAPGPRWLTHVAIGEPA